MFFNWKLNRKIKKANKLHQLTGYKFFVLLNNGKMEVIAKASIKQQIRLKQLPYTLKQIEKKALYKTF